VAVYRLDDVGDFDKSVCREMTTSDIAGETVKRAVASLVSAGKIEHRGSKKTGGYYAL